MDGGKTDKFTIIVQLIQIYIKCKWEWGDAALISCRWVKMMTRRRTGAEYQQGSVMSVQSLANEFSHWKAWFFTLLCLGFSNFRVSHGPRTVSFCNCLKTAKCKQSVVVVVRGWSARHWASNHLIYVKENKPKNVDDFFLFLSVNFIVIIFVGSKVVADGSLVRYTTYSIHKHIIRMETLLYHTQTHTQPHKQNAWYIVTISVNF